MVGETLVVYFTSVFITFTFLCLALLRVLTDGIGVLRTKARPSPPPFISESRWGTHSFIHLKERNIKLHYVEKGDSSKPLMLFLHGFPECWLSWRHQIEEFSSRFRVIAVDLRGYGDSDKPKSSSAYALSQITEDIKHFILAIGGEAKCTLVGHNWGAMVAWELVADRPDLFKRYICINGPHQSMRREALLCSYSQFKNVWYVYFFQFPILPELLIRINDFELLHKFLRGPQNKVDAFPDEVMESYKYYWSHDGLKYPMLYYKFAFEDVPKPESRIDVPTLIVWGKEDQEWGEEIVKKMTNLCSDVQLKWVEGARNFVHEEEPVYVNKLLWDYIRITE